MKKFLIFILVLFLVLILSNFLLYITVCLKNKTPLINFNNIFKENFNVSSYATRYLNIQKFNEKDDTDKNGVIIFGTNFDKGMLAEELSKQMNVTSYNIEIDGSFIQHTILLVQKHYLDNAILNSKNVVFLCPSTSDFLRLDVYPGNITDGSFLLNKYLYPRFKVVNSNDLIEYKSVIPFIKGSVLYKFINKLYNEFQYVHNLKFRTSKEHIFVLHLIKLQYELKKINPQINVSFLMYFNQENEMNNSNIELSNKEINGFYVTSLISNFDELLKDKNMTKHEAAEQSFIWTKVAESLSKKL